MSLAELPFDSSAGAERGLALGYVMNKMAGNLANDVRAMALIEAATAAADAA